MSRNSKAGASQAGLLSCACLSAASYAMGRRNARVENARAGDYDEYFHRLFDETAIAYHDIDVKGIIRRVNRAECDLLGYEPEQLAGGPCGNW
jgi:PAS domain-containing protein